ncbi:MAG TPA: MFS transporter [Solirubrobacteraceae bacterium]|jgi:EmrB/QacA subfamily drug resistance transporter|nr:MFS transporter [Solirubrobacteraceae bacterium]
MTTAQQYLDRRWTALILLCVAQFVVVLDASIVNVALPSIGKGLHFTDRDLPWVVNAYVIAFGGFLLLGGRAADLVGRRRVFMSGLVVVAVASLAAGFASTQGELIAARAAQGLGAAIISPSALSIVTTLFHDGAERNKALGAWGAVAGSGGAAGVLLGGILTEGLGWEWVLWVNVPVSLIALALAPGLIAESRSESTTRHFDAAGAVAVTAGLSVLAYAFLDAGSAGWGSVKIVSLLSVAVLLMGAFVWIESRSDAPLVPFRIFRLRTLTGANVVGLLLGASLFSMFFFISLYMQQVLGYSPIHAGLSYLPLALTIVVAAGLGSQLVTRFGFKPILAVGMLCVAAGLAWFSQISVHGSFLADILGPSLLAAVGLGFGFVTSTIAAVSGVKDRDQGLASGLINTSQQIGGALGLAVLSTIATTQTAHVLAGGTASLHTALTDGFQRAFLGGSVIAALGFVAALTLIRTRDSRAHVEMATAQTTAMQAEPVAAS